MYLTGFNDKERTVAKLSILTLLLTKLIQK